MAGRGPFVHIAAVEAGGTKFALGVVKYSATGNSFEVISRTEVPTTTPEETLSACLRWFSETPEARAGLLSSCGVASFGPVDLEPSSPSFGFITTTPKPDWANTDLLSAFSGHFRLPRHRVGFDTDVNAAALAHIAPASFLSSPTTPSASTAGQAGGADSIAYITVGTGVGVGIVNAGMPQHGLLHPEMGHICVPRHPSEEEGFEGVCPFHRSCVEGMVASRAISRRLQVERTELQSVGDDHPVWGFVAHYLAHLCATLVLTVYPQRIVIGGGIMQRPCLLPAVRRQCLALLNGYIRAPPFQSEASIATYIALSPFGSDAGLLGASILALRQADIQ